MMHDECGMMNAAGRQAGGVEAHRRATPVVRHSVRRRHAASLAIAALVFAGCDDSTTEPPGSEGPSTLTVAAVDAWAYVDLGTSASLVTPTDPSTSTDWDVAFLMTSVMLNGGAAGPGDVSGYCLCANESASDDQLIAMTPDSELAAFEAADVSAVPSNEEDWTTDVLAPSIDAWYNYDFDTHQVSAAPENVWLVRAADSDAIAKFHVVGIDGATQQHAGAVTIEYALKPSADAPFEATQTIELDASSGTVYFDLESGDVSDESDWDIMIEGFTMHVNGGVSGNGNAGAARFNGSFDAITDDTELPPNNVYSGDTFGGVFEAHPWNRYDLEGNHHIWPTYDVYLVRTGSEVYKLQIINYYDDAGTARHITFRYAQLEG